MNSLLLLNEEIVQQASRSTLRPAVPVKARENLLPVKPLDVWRTVDNTLKKTYKFQDVSARNAFLCQLLGYEEDKGHNAVMVVRENQVTVTVTTRDLGKLTELDREYTHAADAIYSDLPSS